MDDTKTFRVRQLQYDCSNIGTVLKMLEFLKPRYAEICVAAEDLLQQLRVSLIADGIEGYLPKVVEKLAEAVGLAAELAAKVEADEEEALERVRVQAEKDFKVGEAKAKAAKIAKLEEDIRKIEVE